MAIPAINVLGNPNVTEGNFQIAIEDLRKSVIGSGKAYDAANTYSQYDTCVSGGIVYYSKINSNTGNTPAINANWGLIGDLFNLLITNGTAFGYGTGSGGTVTQLTSKSTTVTLNKPTGAIITSSSALAANTEIFFVLNNSLLTGNDTLHIVVAGTGGSGIYRVMPRFVINGGAGILLKNDDSASRSESLTLIYTIIKGANS